MSILFSIRRQYATPFARHINSDTHAIIRATLISMLLHGLVFWLAEMLSVHQVVPGKAYPKSEAGPLVVAFRASDNARLQESSLVDSKLAESISLLTRHEGSVSAPGTAVKRTATQRRSLSDLSADQDQAETAFAPPEFTVGIEPRYPLLLFSKGIKGAVTANFQINRAGEIGEIEIVASQPLGAFDEAVMLAIMAAKVRVDKPFPRGRMSITVVFDPAGTTEQMSITQYK